MNLRAIAPEVYAREVLPLTAALWAGRRSFETYVHQTLQTARTTYGRRRYRTIGLYDGAQLVASFKRYERIVRDGARRRRAIGFGAVFTPPEYRGRGYASVMLATALDWARGQGFEIAYLFSDISPQFYATLGFRALASRKISLRADDLPSKHLRPAVLETDDWSGVRRCFEANAKDAPAGFLRTAPVWDWIAMQVRHGSEPGTGRAFNLVVRRNRSVRAYVLGARFPERDAYVVSEYGFAGEAARELVPALLRAAAGDLRRVTGWEPPDCARAVLPRCTTRKRTRATLMMAALHPEARRLIDAVEHASAPAFCWATDHI